MAVQRLYFSTTGAGAADGSSWANRAPLFSGGNWSSLITGFTFSGADALSCYIGPGTYTCSQALTSAIAAPTGANPLYLSACDSSGSLWVPPEPAWVSADSTWDTTNQPVIETTTNVQTISLSNAVVTGLVFNSSERIGSVIGSGEYYWFVVNQSKSNSGARGIDGSGNSIYRNGVVNMLGTIFDYVFNASTTVRIENVRANSNTGATSGNRNGFNFDSGATYVTSLLTAVGFQGSGFRQSNTSAGARLVIGNSAAINCVTGFSIASTATTYCWWINCLITGSTTGISNTGTVPLRTLLCRFRDNTTDISSAGNCLTDSNYTTDSDDASEFVDTASGDYRIKNTADAWGYGFGAGDQPAAGGGSNGFSLSRLAM